MINYVLFESEVFMGKSQTETCCIGRAIEKLIRQGRGLNFSRKDRTFEVNNKACCLGNRSVDITGDYCKALSHKAWEPPNLRI